MKKIIKELSEKEKEMKNIDKKYFKENDKYQDEYVRCNREYHEILLKIEEKIAKKRKNT